MRSIAVRGGGAKNDEMKWLAEIVTKKETTRRG
jgi:hypothetical protein